MVSFEILSDATGSTEETPMLPASAWLLSPERAELAVLPVEHDFYSTELLIPLGCSNLIIWQVFSQRISEVSSPLQGEKLTVFCY